MGELVLDKLTQKVSNMLDEIGDVNILVRRMTPTQETLNRINERVDAVFGALKQLENGVQLDESKLRQLEEQSEMLKEGLQTVKNTVEGLVQKFKQTGEGLKAEVEKLQTKCDQLEELVKAAIRSGNRLADRFDELNLREEKRWENNGKVLVGLQGKLADIKVVGVIVIVLVLLALSIQLFR